MEIPKPPKLHIPTPEDIEQENRLQEHKRKMRLWSNGPKVCGFNAAACDL